MPTKRITTREFRDGFVEWRRTHASTVTGGKWTENFMHFDEIRPGFKLCMAYRSRRPYMIKVELLLAKSVPQAQIDSIVAQRLDIEHEIGAKLCWRLDLDSEKKLQLFNYVDPLLGDPTEHYAWYHDKLELLHGVFAPRIRRVVGT